VPPTPDTKNLDYPEHNTLALAPSLICNSPNTEEIAREPFSYAHRQIGASHATHRTSPPNTNEA